MKTKSFLIIVLITFCFSCKTIYSHNPIINPTTILQKNDSIDLKNWHFKDIILDTLPGISLNRAYDSILINKKGKEITVAVIDSEIDLSHEDLVNHIWENIDEISNNQIDDDKNGYIDDLHGWNFLGNKYNENTEFVNLEETRLLRKYKNYFKDNNISRLYQKDSLAYIDYINVETEFNNLVQYYNSKRKLHFVNDSLFPLSTQRVSSMFKGQKYDIKDIDSILTTSISRDKMIDLGFMRYSLKENLTKTYFEQQLEYYDNTLDKLVNVDFNDRQIQGDDEHDLSDTDYGNNLFGNKNKLDHGTQMGGLISNIGWKDEIKLMSLAISAYGDEHDKDIALAIRYAVDNGAKVINMSFYKERTLYPKWVLEAINYANSKDVLIITISGNEGFDLNETDKYPNDRLQSGAEVSDNFLVVGATGKFEDQNLKPEFSSFGSRDVDLFAPGTNISTIIPDNKYEENVSGTSCAAAITSGVAALIRSYYPDLTASQVKHILMDSGIEYTIPVATPTEENPDKMAPFNQLSKSGKVVNAYNALIMAERISNGN
ncbi:S8 family serine peptidase [Nonlabens sp. Asnod3-A02]|uniref:S8 family serine peptidase n=1 Tax=Nonlabens sp. Asnod3-A02 TaxID=3160579 RepID=UPI003868BFB8